MSRAARAAARSTWCVSVRIGSSQNQPHEANMPSRQRCASMSASSRARSSAVERRPRQAAANASPSTAPMTTST